MEAYYEGVFSRLDVLRDEDVGGDFMVVDGFVGDGEDVEEGEVLDCLVVVFVHSD